MNAEQRICQCGVNGCRQPIDAGGNGRRKYAPGHKQRHYRKSVETAMTAAGLPARPSMNVAKMQLGAGERNGYAQTPRKAAQTGKKRASGKQLAYGKVLAMLIEDGRTLEEATAKLDPLLSKRQRTGMGT